MHLTYVKKAPVSLGLFLLYNFYKKDDYKFGDIDWLLYLCPNEMKRSSS